MSYYQAGYKDGPLATYGMNTGPHLYSRSSSPGSICEKDQVRAFKKPDPSPEKHPVTNPQSMVSRGALDHLGLRPGPPVAHNLVSSQSNYGRRDPSSVPVTEPRLSHYQTPAVLPKGPLQVTPGGVEYLYSSAPNLRTADLHSAHGKTAVGTRPSLPFSSLSSSHALSSLPSSSHPLSSHPLSSHLISLPSSSPPSSSPPSSSHHLSSLPLSSLPSFHPSASHHLSSRPLSPPSSYYSTYPMVHEVSNKATPTGRPSIVILAHPSDLTVAVGERAEFSCKAYIQGSVQNPRYVWYKDDQPLVWEIGQSCTVEGVSPEDAGVYLCLVRDPQGQASVRSRPARLTVKSPPSKEAYTLDILQQPERRVQVVLGEPLRLEVVVRAHPQPTYQWYKDTVALPHATSALLEVGCMAPRHEGEYCCSVTNPLGSRLSNTFTVQAIPVPRPFKPNKPTSLPGLFPADQTTGCRQSNVKSIPPQEVPLSKGFLLSLASTISAQRCSFPRLASYLELSNQDMADIACHASSEQEKTFLMLQRWAERKRKGRGTLVAILNQAGLCLDVEQSAKYEDTPPLQILVRPPNPVSYGNPVTLMVLIDHAHHPTVGYQWYKDGAPLESQHSQELCIHSATEGDCGEYSCDVTTPMGEVLPTRPARVTMASGDPQRRVNYGVMVTNNSGSKGGVAEGGAYPLSYGGGVQLQGGGGGGGMLAVRTACTYNTADDSLRIVTHPQSQQLQPGDPLTLTCSAEGPSPLSYLWLHNGLPLSNETEPSYRINCFTDEDEGLYACEVSSSDGRSAMSDYAEIRMVLDD